MILRTIKSVCNALQTYKRKDFEKLLNSYGYYYDHTRGTHRIFVNSDRHYVVVPYKGKDVNAMMSTVILQRIKHNKTRKL